MSIVLYVVYLVLVIYAWLIIARALLSWFAVRPDHPLFQIRGILVRVTEPYLGLFRRFIPMTRIGGVGLDVSAMIGLIVLIVITRVIVRL